MIAQSVWKKGLAVGVALLSCVVWSLSLGIKVRIVSDSADIRLEPNPESRLISMVPLGSVLEAESMVGEWYRVKLPPNDQGLVLEGYVHSSRVEIQSTVPRADTKAPPPERTDLPTRSDVPGPRLTFEEPPLSGFGISLKLSGGMHKLLMDEVNGAFAGGWTGTWQDDLVYYGGTAGGRTLRPIEYGFDLGLDLILHVSRNIGFGFGVGYIQPNKRTSDVSGTIMGGAVKQTVTPEVRAMPVRAGLFLTIPTGKVVNVVISGGAGYYFAEFKGNVRDESEVEGWAVRDYSARAEGMGYHGTLGFEFNLNNHFAFVLEAQARSAKIEGFEGSYDYRDSTGDADVTRGTLTFFDGDDPFTGKRRQLLSIWDVELEGPGIHEARDAVVDFSGFSLLGGVRVRF